MDDGSWMPIIFLCILAICATYCAAAEISYASMNKIRVKNYAANGDKRAEKAMIIADNFDEALTTLLIGNNIMHIGFGTVAAYISIQLWGIQSLKYTTIIAAVFVFFFTELMPKSYARTNSEKFALAISGSLLALIRILAPVVSLFTSMGQKLSSYFPESQEPEITEAELFDIIEKAREEAVLDRDKQNLVDSALNFDVITVGDIFTNRNDIVALNIYSTHQDIREKIQKQKYSRLPVYEHTIDNIIGILNARTFLKHYVKHDVFDLRSLLAEPHYVNPKTPIDELLREMSSKKLHMSIVVDEAKKVLGIITVEDILEELVGEIWDESDAVYGENLKGTEKRKGGSDLLEINATSSH
ncbi:MAG: hemolysin family protein [bacterium]|jgi:putative hemolysin